MFIEGRLRVDEDRLPENPNLVIRTSVGVWAGVLSGRQRIETAYLLGRLKLTGTMETALTLKKLFSL
jgi:putative sterol carrier protein